MSQLVIPNYTIKIWKANLTQDGLARKAGIPYTTLTKLEYNVVKKPFVQTIAKIAKALNVSIEKLIE
ncbi:MAG: helix-turn-helix transcriptional regulator [Omnitrophica bacterium]|nr:helix-turn-helix transcriptional regulator [Candidatus Omnitrophota bacterium]